MDLKDELESQLGKTVNISGFVGRQGELRADAAGEKIRSKRSMSFPFRTLLCSLLISFCWEKICLMLHSGRWFLTFLTPGDP